MENDPHRASAMRQYHGDHTIFALRHAELNAIETRAIPKVGAESA
jgi:hypothetical protein